MSRSIGIASCLVAVLSFGCPSGPPKPDLDEHAADRALVEVPHPDISELAPKVRQDLREARERIDTVLSTPDAPDNDRSEAFGRLGMLYHAYEFLDAAEACYENAESLDPDEFRWSYYLGRVERAQGEPEAAVASFRRALKHRGSDLPALVQLAEAEADAGRGEVAEAVFNRSLMVDPDCAPALVGLGELAAARKDHDEAVRLFEAALQADPAATAVNYPLGLAYRALGDNEKARTLLEQRGEQPATVSDPLMMEVQSLAANWVVHLDRGTSLINEGRHEEALVELEKAAEAAPEEAVVRLNIGSALTLAGDLEGAAAAYEEAVRLDPRNATAYFNLGTLAARSGDDSSAVERYRSALAIDPDMMSVHFNLANALRRLERSEEAVEHYRKIVDSDPGNEAARLGEIFALLRLGLRAEALQRLEQGHEALPESGQIRNALARLLAAAPEDSLRDGPRALALAEGLVEAHRALPFVVTLAMAAAEVGDFPLALEWQEAAIEAVRQSGNDALLAELEANLALYRDGRPCRVPWREDDPLLSPRARR